MIFLLIYAILELTKGESKVLRDKIIIAELKKQGIRESDFYSFILKNPHTKDKLDAQADISLKVATGIYYKILKKRGIK